MKGRTLACAEVRRRLQDGFDRGLPMDPALDQHLDCCADCMAYAGRLHALDEAFAGLPLPQPSQGFARRARERTRALPAPDELRRAIPVLAVACIAVLALGWFFPVGGYLTLARTWAAAWGMDTVAPLVGTAGYVRDTVRAAWYGDLVIQTPDPWALLDWLEGTLVSWRDGAAGYLPHAPAGVLWAGLAAGILFIIGFNGVQLRAIRLRGHI